MEVLSNTSKLEIMRMLNSIKNIRTSECGLYAHAEDAGVDKVIPWIYTFYTKSTENYAYRKALEALVGVIEKDNTSIQRASIFFLSKIC